MGKTYTATIKQVDRVARVARKEFEALGDYIWKTPRLIELETRSEAEKVRGYLPHNPELARERWAHESRHLFHVFPYYMAQGNLLISAALFELRLLHLGKTLEPLAVTKLSEMKGMGSEKLFRFLEQFGIRRDRIDGWEQIAAGLTIRNALTHAGGALEYSRDAEQLRNIVKGTRFLPRKMLKERGETALRKSVKLIQHRVLGARIQITNDYPHWIVHRFRDCFVLLCDELIIGLQKRRATK